MKTRLQSLVRSVGMRHGLILSAAMILAGALDYVANVLAGRWLAPVEFGVFVSVAAILQVFLYLSIAIRNVVAFYTADLSVEADQFTLGAFVQRAWRWAWQWGLAVTALVALLSVPSGRLLRLSNPWPLWAATPMIFALFLRPVTDGVLQGMQAFGRLGLVHASQACVRLLFTAGLIWLGHQAVGAIFALPIACFAALVLARLWLRPQFRDAGEVIARRVSWHYSAHTLLGLAVFGMLVSLDARPVLLVALAGVLVPGLILATICFMFPGSLVRTVFGAAYANPSIILGLACLAAGLYAGLNIWLNYALSLERPAFIYALLGVLLLQGLCMFLFGRGNLVYMTLVMVSGGLLGNLAGFITTWSFIPTVKVVRAEAVGS